MSDEQRNDAKQLIRNILAAVHPVQGQVGFINVDTFGIDVLEHQINQEGHLYHVTLPPELAGALRAAREWLEEQEPSDHA